jgi:hypothetical protein
LHLNANSNLSNKLQFSAFSFHLRYNLESVTQTETMDKLTAPGKAERPSEPAPATPVNTSAYTDLLSSLTSTFDNHLLDSDLSIHSYNHKLESAMADRFPSLEDFSEGT